MGSLIIYRKRGFELTPVHIEINNDFFSIKRGERKEVNLPVGICKVIAHGWFGQKSSIEIEIKEDTPTVLILTHILPYEFSIIGIVATLVFFVFYCVFFVALLS